MDKELIMYRETDFEDCVQIYVDAFTAPPLNYDFLTKEKAWRYISDLIKTPGFMGYTYWLDGKMTAFCFGKLDNYFDGSVFKVEELAVASMYHRSGIGTAVMKLLAIKLAGYNVSAINLQTSRTFPAFDFYLKNGYEELTDNVSLFKWIEN
ncbi:MAG: GNAT family N-acetyltransferase [Defluviitaleaceae bacterium]|nr:GNAT family N-acetyltransferase [Defluviitaleaceae bacterium]